MNDRIWMTRDGYHPELDGGQIWITTGYGWMTGGGSQETDDNQSPSL